MKTFFVMRGIPGSGKSTLAKKMAASLVNSIILSTDNFWMMSGDYKFDASKMRDAHEWNFKEFKKALGHYDNIFLDNTNIKRRDFQRYVDLAKTMSYEIEEVIPSNPDAFNLEACYKRNVHAVPYGTIKRMRDEFES